MTTRIERRADATTGSATDIRGQRATTTALARRHILHIFPTFGIGGVPLRIANVINRLGGAYRHTIVALDDCYDSRRSLDGCVNVSFADFTITKRNALRSMWIAACQVRALRPDVLATYNWGSIDWALANTLVARRHHVHFESGFGPEEADRQIPRRVWMRRLALAGAAGLIVPSHTLERLAREVWRINDAKIRRVANGVDVDKYQAASRVASAFGVSRLPGELIVGTVAPLRREKNLGRLLRAYAALPDIGRPTRLIIAGDGNERASLEHLADELGIGRRTLFLGHVDAVEQVLGLVDVFAMSSDTEQMPNALLQAMAAGRAVASVDVGDVGIIVAPENYPFIVPRDDTGALTGALARLLRDDVLRSQTAHANLAHVRSTYSMDRMLEAYQSIYNGHAPGSRA